jgi:PilZ domain.
MDDNRRESPRFGVSLYTERIERESNPARILNLSVSGFLVRCDLCAGPGGVFHAVFRVRPSSGDMRISTRGTVMHTREFGAEYEYGIRIDGFGSPEEESAYQTYVLELAK